MLILENASNSNIKEGKISSIKYSTNKITITLKNQTTPLIIFENKRDNKILDLKKGDKMQFKGRENTYKNKKQIIIDKIIKLK